MCSASIAPLVEEAWYLEGADAAAPLVWEAMVGRYGVGLRIDLRGRRALEGLRACSSKVRYLAIGKEGEEDILRRKKVERRHVQYKNGEHLDRRALNREGGYPASEARYFEVRMTRRERVKKADESRVR